MVHTNSARIVDIVNEDDGTTGGKTVYIDEYGKRWVPTSSTRESCGTGETIGTIENGIIWV